MSRPSHSFPSSPTYPFPSRPFRSQDTLECLGLTPLGASWAWNHWNATVTNNRKEAEKPVKKSGKKTVRWDYQTDAFRNNMFVTVVMERLESSVFHVKDHVTLDQELMALQHPYQRHQLLEERQVGVCLRSAVLDQYDGPHWIQRFRNLVQERLFAIKASVKNRHSTPSPEEHYPGCSCQGTQRSLLNVRAPEFHPAQPLPHATQPPHGLYNHGQHGTELAFHETQLASPGTQPGGQGTAAVNTLTPHSYPHNDNLQSDSWGPLDDGYQPFPHIGKAPQPSLQGTADVNPVNTLASGSQPKHDHLRSDPRSPELDLGFFGFGVRYQVPASLRHRRSPTDSGSPINHLSEQTHSAVNPPAAPTSTPSHRTPPTEPDVMKLLRRYQAGRDFGN